MCVCVWLYWTILACLYYSTTCAIQIQFSPLAIVLMSICLSNWTLLISYLFCQVFHCFGQYFCLHFEAFQLGMAPVYMAFLRFMGDETEARNYSYSLEVGANGRKLIWEGTPRSIRDSHRKVRDSHDGLIIQRNMALFFSGGDRKELKLRVTGRIWKEQQNSDAGVCIPNLCSWGRWYIWEAFSWFVCLSLWCCTHDHKLFICVMYQKAWYVHCCQKF